MSITDLIEKANLYDKTDKEITFEDKSVSYTIARKKHEFFGGKTYSYAEYYLLELNDELLSIISNYKTYKEFQLKFLAPYFYKHMNDLRWNLYLIFLITDEGSLKNIDIGTIENDDNYARKFFFNYEDTLKFLKREDILSVDENNKSKSFKSGQFQKWVELLDSVRLTGCLTDSPLRNENVDKYLEMGSFEDKSFLDISPSASLAEPKKNMHIDKVESLDMGKFRDHCFRKTGAVVFGQVNLLQGPNGCGKTSITEAIELAVTNDIKRLKDMREELGGHNGLKAILKSGSISNIYCPRLTTSTYKQIDSDWYGVPNVGNSHTTLNKNFNRFNYFDADAANRFTREQSLNSDETYDYRDGLKKLFFDNETVNMEKRWSWYYDKFNERQKKLEKEFDVLKQNILDESNLEKLTKSGSPNTNEIISLASEVEYNDHALLRSGDQLQSLRALNETLKAVDNTVEKLSDASKLQGIQCYNDVLLRETEINKVVEELKTKLVEAVNDRGKYTSEIENLIKKEEEQDSIKHKFQKDLEQLEKDILVWQDVKHIIINYNRLNDLKRFINNKKKIQKKLTLISDLKIKYLGIENISEEDILGNESIDIVALKEEIISLEERRNKIVKKIKILNLREGQVDSLRAKLKALGEEYLRISGDDGICPLCGHPHLEKSYLEKSINNVSFQRNETLEVKILEKEKNDIDNLISQKNELLMNEKKRLDKIQCVSEAYKEIYESDCYNIDSKKEDIISIFEDVQRILKQCDSLNVDLKMVEAMIESITKEGYTNEKIVLAENYKSSNIRLIKYINEGKDVTFYLEHMLVNKNKLIGDIAVIKDLIVELEAKKIGLQSKADQYDAIANEKIIEIGLRQKAIQGLSDVKNYFMVLKRHFDFNDSYDIFLWTENFNMLKTRCSSEISHLQDALSIKESKEKQKGLEEKKKLLAEQIIRCHTANMIFELMPKLDDAVYDFLEKNKEKIIYFFQMLHMPKEFESKLEYDEKGYFKLIRKGSNDEVRCPQMSTGQRVSFTLSVFFSLHLSAINAPSFIMLDEPVTNLDDVHLLNLLDILRDFSLNGTQIFFTTANQEVAGLFRRKFSFFEEEFIHLKFERTNNLPVIIKKITYNPMEDAGNEILLEASTR